jgi:hypothetical protein
MAVERNYYEVIRVDVDTKFITFIKAEEGFRNDFCCCSKSRIPFIHKAILRMILGFDCSPLTDTHGALRLHKFERPYLFCFFMHYITRLGIFIFSRNTLISYDKLTLLLEEVLSTPPAS